MYVSSCYQIARLPESAPCYYVCVRILLYMCPYTPTYVSVYYHICVLILLYTCLHTRLCVVMLHYVSRYQYIARLPGSGVLNLLRTNPAELCDWGKALV